MLLNRIIRAIKLDKTLYPEVKSDETLTNEALMVIIAVIIAGAIGAFLSYLIIGVGFGSAILWLIISLVLGALGVGLFIFLAHFVGTRFFEGQATLKEMLRSLGYAQSPMLIGLLSFIPIIGVVFSWLALVLTLVTSVIATRETMGMDTTKAAITTAIAWVAEVIIVAVIGGVIGGAIITAAVMASL